MLILNLAMYFGVVCLIHGQVNRKDFFKKVKFDDVTNGTNMFDISLESSIASEENTSSADYASGTVDLNEYDDVDLIEPEESENDLCPIVYHNTNSSSNSNKNNTVREFLTKSDIKYVNIQDDALLTEPGLFDVDNPVMTVTSFCPTRNVCDNGNEYTFSENYCCIPCQCNNNCFSYGTCCFDESFDSIHTPTKKEKCVVPSIGDKSMYTGAVSKRLLYRCDSNAGEEAIIKCKQWEENFRELKQLIPVNNHVTLKTYKSIYCAECENEKSDFDGMQLNQFSYWETHLICKNVNVLAEVIEKIFYHSGNIIDKLNAMNGCYVYWYSDWETVRCFKRSNAIRACTNPNFYDPRVIRFCHKGLYHPVKGIHGIYHNLFCLVCNEGFGVMNGTCMSPFNDIHEGQNSRVALRLPQNVADVLDALDNGLPAPSLSFSDGKIQKMCPITSMTVGSVCTVILNELKGIGFDFLVKITFPEPIARNIPDSKILENVRSLIQDVDDVMTVCVERVLDRYEDGTKTIAVVQQTLKSREFVDLKKEYASFKERVETLNREARNFAIPFTVELISYPLQLISDRPVSFVSYSDVFVSNECGRSVAMTDLQFCETFMFKRILQIRKDQIEVNGIPFAAGEFLMKLDTELSVFICRDLYSIRNSEAEKLAVFSSATSNEPKLVSFVIGMLIGYVCAKYK